MLTKIKEITDIYLRWVITAFVVMLLLRITDYIFINIQDTFQLYISWQLFLNAALLDMILLARVSIILYPIFVLISFLSKKISVAVLFLGLFLFVLLSVFLIIYTALSGTLLDAVILFYSNESAIHVVQTYLGMLVWLILIPLVILTLAYLLFRLFGRLRMTLIRYFYILVIVVFAFIPYYSAFNFFSDYNKLNELNYQNKVFYLIQDIRQNIKNENKLMELTQQMVSSYYEYFPEKKYNNKNYPLLYDSGENPDVLSPFFTSFTQPPNIVFIIAEGLGRDISGKGASMASFTPYLDSLSQAGLYWPNAISTADRTFGALPAIFGSLPFSSESFINMKEEMPLHYSLIHNLKINNYTARFFYGGWKEFDNMDKFFFRQNGDYFLHNFGDSYKSMDTVSNLSWGYGDKELAKRSFEVVDSMKSTPNVDVYLTLTNHYPWSFSNQNYYLQKLSQHLKLFEFSDSVKTEINRSIYRLSAILCMDDAIRDIINGYRKRSGYENTIFIITGDHALNNHPDESIRHYHVPLLIYSPKLMRTAVFPAVNSHLDIAPSIEAFLRKSCGLKFPEMSHYIGTSLDTCHQFRNLKKQIFQINNRSVIQILFDKYYLDKNSLYELDSNLVPTLIKNASLTEKAKKMRDDITKVHFSVSKNKLLVPEYLFRKEYKLFCLHPSYLQTERDKSLIASKTEVVKHQVIHLKKGYEFEGIASFTLSPNKINVGYLDLSFEYKLASEKSDPDVVVVFSCQDTITKNTFWKSFPLSRWDKGVNKFKVKMVLPFNTSNYKGFDFVNLYLWSTNETEIYMYNTSLNLYVE